MLASFVITLMECLEIGFITLMLAKANVNLLKVYSFAALGLVGGVFASVFLYDLIEDYEWAMYAILSGLMVYLFLKGKDLAAHVKEHINEIQTATSPVVVFATVFFIYARESFEIITSLLIINNGVTPLSMSASANWYVAGAGVATAVVIVTFFSKSRYNKYLFQFGHWTYLAFALFFGYEALEYLHWL